MAMNIEQIFTILSGLITLATAWFGYKAAIGKKTSLLTEKKGNKIVQFTDPTVRTHSWAMRKNKYYFALPSILVSLFFTVVFWDLSFAIFSIVLNLFLIFTLSLWRDEPPSRTIKTAEFTIKGSREKILRECLAALEKYGVRVGKFDSVEGIIIGSTKMTMWSFGEIITIEMSKSSPQSVYLRVSSDCVNPSTLIDWGKNARNIQQIKSELLR
jgi:hypothetical protein